MLSAKLRRVLGIALGDETLGAELADTVDSNSEPVEIPDGSFIVSSTFISSEFLPAPSGSNLLDNFSSFPLVIPSDLNLDAAYVSVESVPLADIDPNNTYVFKLQEWDSMNLIQTAASYTLTSGGQLEGQVMAVSGVPLIAGNSLWFVVDILDDGNPGPETLNKAIFIQMNFSPA
jgi:hypothetical protein